MTTLQAALVALSMVAVSGSTIFFDLDGIYGQLEMAEALQQLIWKKAPESNTFLAHIARNALLRSPPLGFFRKFVLEPDGGHEKNFNLKERGTAPISDLIRVHALACGSQSLNTLERLEDVNATQLLPEGVGDDLTDALEFISMVRIRHQARQIAGTASSHRGRRKWKSSMGLSLLSGP